MGGEIRSSEFNKSDELKFLKKLRYETKVLKGWFETSKFEKPKELYCGLELEGWLTDENFLPIPLAKEFLEEINNPLIVPEISKFNFEINTPPQKIHKSFLSDYHQTLNTLVQSCQQSALKLGARALFIGSLPTLKEDMLSLNQLFPNQRYYALNNRILNKRKKAKVSVNIDGFDHYDHEFDSLMIESAATSSQFHLQVSQEESCDLYNASLIASAFMAAVCSNSPFLFGQNLWQETRIPIFEQAALIEAFPRLQGRHARYVTLGSGYLRHSLLEIFLENLDGYHPLLPEVSDSAENEMKHLNLQNGIIWRWNRAIIGTSENNRPHLRIEHRVPSAGPTQVDTIANLGFYIGLVHFLKANISEIIKSLPFEDVRRNFYSACKDGLHAKVSWQNSLASIQEVLHNELIPESRNTLLKMGVQEKDLEFYFDDVLIPRSLSGLNGAEFQNSFVQTHGKRFQDLLEVYYDYQLKDTPIHRWKV